MINKIKAKLKKSLIKANVIETAEIGDEIYKIIDFTSPIPFIKDRRNFSFKNDEGVYSHSAIYLNPKYRFQPILLIPQKIIATWSKTYPIKNALVLGCAGCSVPRFIGLSYPESKTIGVELSEDFITIAKKHFLLEQIEKQFDLVQGDAIEYIKKYQLETKQDIIYIDIFNKNKIIKDIFTEDFITSAFNCTSENGLIIINILGENIDEVKAFFNSLNLPFSNMAAVKNNAAQFFILTKSNDQKKTEEFINNLQSEKNFSVS